VVMGYQVANELGCPLHIIAPRKFEPPHDPEYAIGAVAQDGSMVLDQKVVKSLGISSSYLEEAKKREIEEIERRMKMYRKNLSEPQIVGKTAIIVDDGIATGSTIKAAILSVKKKNPALLVVAVPVGAPDSIAEIKPFIDDRGVLARLSYFAAVGLLYQNFGQTRDQEVIGLLQKASGPLLGLKKTGKEIMAELQKPNFES
ncbi:putative phosphoribosyl transferase, partial [Candidatus Hakubella thermalkaliphila]